MCVSTLQANDSSVIARVAAMEHIIPEIQVNLSEIAGNLKRLMDRIGMEQSLPSEKRVSKKLRPISETNVTVTISSDADQSKHGDDIDDGGVQAWEAGVCLSAGIAGDQPADEEHGKNKGVILYAICHAWNCHSVI